ncbi:hypothetical protein GCM10010345_50680 [Streptomyces canarius]|uniref:Uncharacterized protein n=1 Tax=Streptomyces canarius TaxID=285453 RepID=A0ABQ3CSV2_9ACTN|nr:hypothetical protein GCM10010345_50680 [Streptomyces canarius]
MSSATCPKDGKGPPYVLQGLAVVPQHPPHVRPPVQHPGPGVPTAPRDPPLEGREPLPRAPRVHQCDPEGREHIGLPVGRLGTRGQVPGPPQMPQRDPQIAEVPLPDAEHLVGDARVDG